MKVKIFDENHEKDLEKAINEFLKNNEIDVIDIKYQVGVGVFSEEQIYCFSALIIYTE
jgi:ribose 5-phosphate isomerase RpiB